MNKNNSFGEQIDACRPLAVAPLTAGDMHRKYRESFGYGDGLKRNLNDEPRLHQKAMHDLAEYVNVHFGAGDKSASAAIQEANTYWTPAVCGNVKTYFYMANHKVMARVWTIIGNDFWTVTCDSRTVGHYKTLDEAFSAVYAEFGVQQETA